MSAPGLLIPVRPDRIRRVIRRPNLGLYLGRSKNEIPRGGLSQAQNVRLRQGRIENENVGYEKFVPDALTGPVTLIDTYILRTGTEILIVGTTLDLYRYDTGLEAFRFITPRFNTGTCDVTNGSAVVQLNAAAFTATNIKPGDRFHAGNATQNNPAAIWYTILSVNVGLQRITLTTNYAEATQAGIAYTVRQCFSGTSSDIWSSETFPDAQPQDEDTWYATQGVTEVDRGPEMVKWDGADATVTRFDPGFTARVLRRVKDQLLYGDIVESTGESKPYVFAYSEVSIPETIAGQLNGTEGVDDLLAIESLGDFAVLYHARSKNLAQFVGPPLDWVVRTVIPDSGVVSGRAIATFPDFHVALTDEGLARFNGVGEEPIATQVFRDVMRRLDNSRAIRAIAHVNEEHGEGYLVVPLTTDGSASGGPALAYSIHYLEDVGRSGGPLPVMSRELPATAMGYTTRGGSLRFSDIVESFEEQNFRWNDRFFGAAFPISLFGDDQGFLYQLNTLTSKDGASMTSLVTFAREPLVDGRSKGVLRRVEPFAQKRAGAIGPLSCYVAFYDFAEDTSLGGETFAAGFYDLTQAGERFVAFRNAGRYMDVQFFSIGVELAWDLAGYGIESVPAGER